MADPNARKKPRNINPSSDFSFTDILKPFATAGSAIYIAIAIKAHTRAMVAFEFLRDGKGTLTPQEAFKMADMFLAAGKKPNTPTDKTAGE